MAGSGDDPFDLRRFVDAQAPIYPTVLGELRAGVKRSHWMWFVFPQLSGLGSSPTAVRFALAGLAEATAYLDHAVLGTRLVECTGLVVHHDDKTVEQIFGWPDHLKFHSSMTLFSQVDDADPVFGAALDHCFAGRQDEGTMRLLQG